MIHKKEVHQPDRVSYIIITITTARVPTSSLSPGIGKNRFVDRLAKNPDVRDCSSLGGDKTTILSMLRYAGKEEFELAFFN